MNARGSVAGPILLLLLTQINWTTSQTRIPPWVTKHTASINGQTFLHLPCGKAVPYKACYDIRDNVVNGRLFNVDLGNDNLVNLSCREILRIGLPCHITVNEYTVSLDLFKESLTCDCNQMFVELSNGVLLSYDLFCDQINSENPKIAVPKLLSLPDVNLDEIYSGDIFCARKNIPHPMPLARSTPEVGQQQPYLKTEVQPQHSVLLTSKLSKPQLCIPISCQPELCNSEPSSPQQCLPEPFPPQTCLPQPCLPEPCIPTPYPPEPCNTQPCLPQPCLPEPCIPTPCPPEPCIPQPCLPQPCLPQPYIATPCLLEPCLSQPCLPQPCTLQPCITLSRPPEPCLSEACPLQPCPQLCPPPSCIPTLSQPDPCIFQQCLAQPCLLEPCLPQSSLPQPCTPQPCIPPSCPPKHCTLLQSCPPETCFPHQCPPQLCTPPPCIPTLCPPEPCHPPLFLTEPYPLEQCPPGTYHPQPCPYQPYTPTHCHPSPHLPQLCQMHQCTQHQPCVTDPLFHQILVREHCRPTFELEPIFMCDHCTLPISCCPTPTHLPNEWPSCKRDCGPPVSSCHSAPSTIHSSFSPGFTTNYPFSEFHPNFLFI